VEDHRESAGVDRVRLQILIHMNALNHFIVNVPKKHEDTIKLGDTEIFLESKFNEFDHRISHGEIVSVPMRYDTGAKPGDTLIFHHHVTMNKALSLGDNNHVAMYDDENTNLSQCIAYRCKDTGDLHMLCDWLFVEPIEPPSDDTEESGIVTKLGAFKEQRDVARIYMTHPDLERQGVSVGDVVGFEKNSDYRIKLDNGDIVYRMLVANISYVEVEEVHDD